MYAAICNPYYYQVPQSNLGFYPVPPAQHHNSATLVSHNLPGDCSTRASSGGVSSNFSLSGHCAAMMINMNNALHDGHDLRHQDQNVGVRTLDLFPVHPTGILEHKVGSTNSTNFSSPTNSSIDTHTSDTGNQQQQRLFDFFSSESD